MPEDIDQYATCPKCHTRIFYLIETERVYATFNATPDVSGKLHYHVIYIDPDSAWAGNYYRCPKCDAIVANSEEEAIALFQKSKVKNKQNEDKK